MVIADALAKRGLTTLRYDDHGFGESKGDPSVYVLFYTLKTRRLSFFFFEKDLFFQCTNADQQTWAEAVSGKFLLWKQNEMTFKAYYPATEGTSMTAFTLPADQSSVEKIALADYMTRQRTVSNVRIKSQYSAIADGNNGTGDNTEVSPYMQGTGVQGSTYTALVVPGYDDSSADFITLTDALNNTLTVKGIPELEAGYSYTYNLTVGKNTIQVQSITVTDWTTANDGRGVTATCAVTVTALAGVFVNGATLIMNNFKFEGIKGQALTITYNGTGFSATPSGSMAGDMSNNTVTVNGKKITVQCSNGWLVITWFFDTATDHYTYTASVPAASEDASNAGSFLLNGTDITSRLTKD